MTGGNATTGAADGPAGAHPDGGPHPDDFDRPVFAATIRPHRSLGRTGFRVLMVLCGAMTFAVSLVFVRLGFWPIAGFFGLDWLALYVAFRVSFQRGRSFEEVVVTRIEVLLRRVTARGERREWRFNPAWTRLHKVLDDEYGLMALAVLSRGQRVDVARDVSPDERATIADGLGRALAEVKRGY